MAKIALFCMDKIGTSMAGPAIRYWEMAHALAKEHDIILITCKKSDISSDTVRLVSLQDANLSHFMQPVEIMITQTITPGIAFVASKYGIRLILDAYDPMPLENLEIFKHQNLKTRIQKHNSICKQFAFDFLMANGVICANKQQRDLWMGLLLSNGKITPQLYDKMPSLDGLLGIVPFGMSSTPPIRSGSGLRERFGISATDKVLLWGGGIWNWFDPLTLLRAMAEIVKIRQDVHLVFMGIKHPNDEIPEMEMCRETIALAKELDLLDKFVHINFDWVPYNERQNFLLDADFGLSTHFNNLETTYSFRTRMLDYIWAGLPIIATEGDSFADLIQSQNLGVVVPFKDQDKLAAAILSLCDNRELVNEIKRNLHQIKPRFYWNNVVNPLREMITQLEPSKPKISLAIMAKVVIEVWKSKGPMRIVQFAWKKVLQALRLKPQNA